MPQLTDDCFAHGGPMMTTAEALARIGEIASAVTDSETVPLASAAGRILAADPSTPLRDLCSPTRFEVGDEHLHLNLDTPEDVNRLALL